MKKQIFLMSLALVLTACGAVGTRSVQGDGSSEYSNEPTYRDLGAYMMAQYPSLDIEENGIGGYDVHIIGMTRPPLVLVDGVQVRNFSEANSFVRPDDIESVSVERDGTIYGTRGMGGVIDIKTKSGGR